MAYLQDEVQTRASDWSGRERRLDALQLRRIDRTGENVPEVNRWRPEELKVPSGVQVNLLEAEETETTKGI